MSTLENRNVASTKFAHLFTHTYLPDVKLPKLHNLDYELITTWKRLEDPYDKKSTVFCWQNDLTALENKVAAFHQRDGNSDRFHSSVLRLMRSRQHVVVIVFNSLFSGPIFPAHDREVSPHANIDSFFERLRQETTGAMSGVSPGPSLSALASSTASSFSGGGTGGGVSRSSMSAAVTAMEDWRSLASVDIEHLAGILFFPASAPSASPANAPTSSSSTPAAASQQYSHISYQQWIKIFELRVVATVQLLELAREVHDALLQLNAVAFLRLLPRVSSVRHLVLHQAPAAYPGGEVLKPFRACALLGFALKLCSASLARAVLAFHEELGYGASVLTTTASLPPSLAAAMLLNNTNGNGTSVGGQSSGAQLQQQQLQDGAGGSSSNNGDDKNTTLGGSSNDALSACASGAGVGSSAWSAASPTAREPSTGATSIPGRGNDASSSAPPQQPQQQQQLTNNNNNSSVPDNASSSGAAHKDQQQQQQVAAIQQKTAAAAASEQQLLQQQQQQQQAAAAALAQQQQQQQQSAGLMSRVFGMARSWFGGGTVTAAPAAVAAATTSAATQPAAQPHETNSVTAATGTSAATTTDPSKGGQHNQQQGHDAQAPSQQQQQQQEHLVMFTGYHLLRAIGSESLIASINNIVFPNKKLLARMGSMSGWEISALGGIAPKISCYFVVFQRALPSFEPVPSNLNQQQQQQVPKHVTRCRDGSVSLFASAMASIASEDPVVISKQVVPPPSRSPSVSPTLNGKASNGPQPPPLPALGGAATTTATNSAASSASAAAVAAAASTYHMRACLSASCVDHDVARRVAEFARPLTTTSAVANGQILMRESPTMQAAVRGEFPNPCFCFAAVMCTLGPAAELTAREAQMMVCSDLAAKLNGFLAAWNREQDLSSMSSRLEQIRVHSTIDGLF